MSGVAVAIAATAAVGSLGYSIYSGEQSAKDREKAARQAKQDQNDAVDRANAQDKKNEEAQRRATARTPDVRGILDSARQMASGGMGSTMLTGGPGGVSNQDLSNNLSSGQGLSGMLGKTSLLG